MAVLKLAGRRVASSLPRSLVLSGDVAIFGCLWAEGPRDQSTGVQPGSALWRQIAQAMRPERSREIQSLRSTSIGRVSRPFRSHVLFYFRSQG